MKTKNLATAFAILAAALYAINVPLSKFLLDQVGPTMMAALLIMIAATVLMVRDTVELQHTHEHTHVHSHAHSHLHTHGSGEQTHDHRHNDLKGHSHPHPA